MRKKTILTLLLAFILLLCGCAKTVVEQQTKYRASTGDTWTIMIYMCGSSMEEDYGAASEVLGKLAYDLPENVRVIVETGGCRKWHTDNIYHDYLQDFMVQKNGIRLIHQAAAKNMGSSETLSEFLSRNMAAYPARHYMTVLWGYGGGAVGGTAYDSMNKFDSLSLTELKSAFAGLNQKMDIIGFDASLMSGLETASALSLYADYMVASEDVMTEGGWDYKGLLEFISNNPSADGAAIGRVICDGAAERASAEDEYFISMAVTDLTRYSALAQAFDSVAAEMIAATENVASLRRLQGALDKTVPVGGSSKWEGYSNAVDLGSFARALKGFAPDGAAKLSEALESTVLYRNISEYRKDLSGLNVFVPMGASNAELEEYISNCPSSGYAEFLRKTCIYNSSEEIKAERESTEAWQEYNNMLHENELTAEYGLDNKFILHSTHPEIIKSAVVNIYIYDKKSESYMLLSSDDNTEFDSANSGYVYNMTGKILQFGGSIATVYKLSSGTEYDIYSIPVIKNGSLQNIRAIKAKGKKDNVYNTLGLWKGTGKYTGLAYSSFGKLEAGDVVTPLCEAYGADSSKFVENSDIRVGIGEVRISEKTMKDGLYLLSYTVEDIYGQTYESNPVNISVAKGTIRTAIK